MDYSISESPNTVRGLPQRTLSELRVAAVSEAEVSLNSSNLTVSAQSSPRSTALPSPPDSPSTGSVSSLPSVSSSFFFSSAAASPRFHSRPLSDHGHEHEHDSDNSRSPHSHDAAATQGLIIPSLTLPPALRRPTPYGQSMGEVRLLVLGRQGVGKSFLTGLLLEDNDEVVEVGTWEDPVIDEEDGEEAMILLGKSGAKVLRASTDWFEQTDPHGLERFEPMRNIEIVELPGYNSYTDGNALVANLKNVIHAPFHTLVEVLHPESQPSAVLANMISSASTPLFTALVLLLPSTPTPLDKLIIDSLGPHIPIIALTSPPSASSASSTSSFSFFSSRNSPADSPPPVYSHPTFSSSFASSVSSRESQQKLSSFRPFNAAALKNGLFHSPETLAVLRMEAAERFLRWREVEKAVSGILGERARVKPDSRRRRYEESRSRARSQSRGRGLRTGWDKWDKEKWEREWMENFSTEVSLRLREDSGDSVLTAVGAHSQPPPSYTDDLETPMTWDSKQKSFPSTLSEKIFDKEERGASNHHHLVLHHSQSFDPLHLPSLLWLTVSMLGPLKSRIVDLIKSTSSRCWEFVVPPQPTTSISRDSTRSSTGVGLAEKNDRWQARWAVMGGLVGLSFGVGVGVGNAISSAR